MSNTTKEKGTSAPKEGAATANKSKIFTEAELMLIEELRSSGGNYAKHMRKVHDMALYYSDVEITEEVRTSLCFSNNMIKFIDAVEQEGVEI